MELFFLECALMLFKETRTCCPDLRVPVGVARADRPVSRKSRHISRVEKLAVRISVKNAKAAWVDWRNQFQATL